MPWFRETPALNDPLPPQQLFIRQGDRLPAFCARVEDQYGRVLDLTGCRAFLTLRPVSPTSDGDPPFQHLELTVENAGAGIVSYDWQQSQTSAADIGVYDVIVDVERADGGHVAVPSVELAAQVIVRSEPASGFFARDANGFLVPDGVGGYELA